VKKRLAGTTNPTHPKIEKSAQPPVAEPVLKSHLPSINFLYIPFCHWGVHTVFCFFFYLISLLAKKDEIFSI
jgi:hypothetical protein